MFPHFPGLGCSQLGPPRISIHDFLVPYRGTLLGRSYDSPTPPPRVFANHPLTREHSAFVTKKVAEELRIGVVRLWSRVGEVAPPHLVLPIVVEPSKPRILVRNLFLLDDSFGLRMHRSPPAGVIPFQSAGAACYLVVALMVGLGYFVHPTKSGSFPPSFSFGWGSWLTSGQALSMFRNIRPRTLCPSCSWSRTRLRPTSRL
jgi:hypothetical protein